MIIGVSGLTCVGKTTYAEKLKDDHIMIHLDIMGKEKIMNNEKVVSFLDSKNIKREELRNELFNDLNFMISFNKIVVPIFNSELNYIIENNHDKNIIIEGFLVPLLDIKFDKIKKLKKNNFSLIRRLAKRDKISRNDAKKMILIQKKFLKFYK